MTERSIRRKVYRRPAPDSTRTGVDLSIERRNGWWYWRAEYRTDRQSANQCRWSAIALIGFYPIHPIAGRARTQDKAWLDGRLAASFMRERITEVQADQATKHKERVW